MKGFRCYSPCVQIMKISSMDLHQMNGLSKELSMACCSNLPMNKWRTKVPPGFPKLFRVLANNVRF